MELGPFPDGDDAVSGKPGTESAGSSVDRDATTPALGEVADKDEPPHGDEDEQEALAGATASDEDAGGERGVSEPLSAGSGMSAVYADGMLLADADGLRANWQSLQAGFIDDPRAAVADAADLVEHASQALVGALRLRQQQLRDMWDGAGSRDGGRARTGRVGAENEGGAQSTEQFRVLMQRYRSLFNQICRS